MLDDPADRETYQIGVLCEKAGRGGSALLHCSFTRGRRLFVSKPINHFGLASNAPKVHAARAKCALISGDIEYRVFVQSRAQRAGSLILCQSQAGLEGGVFEIDL